MAKKETRKSKRIPAKSVAKLDNKARLTKSAIKAEVKSKSKTRQAKKSEAKPHVIVTQNKRNIIVSLGVAIKSFLAKFLFCIKKSIKAVFKTILIVFKYLVLSIKHILPRALLLGLWIVITGVFTAIPGDLLYFPKALVLNEILSPLQKIELMWPGYLKTQEMGNCVQSSLVQQELLREITAQVAVDKNALLESVDSWNTSKTLNCEVLLPVSGLKSLAQMYVTQVQSESRYALVNITKSLNIHVRVLEQIDAAQNTGFKSQRALDEFSELALSLRDYKPNLSNIQYLDLYQKDLEIKTLKNILETGKPIAVNYQELFLASCLLSPEYEVCQSPDKFNAKWNSVAAAGSIKNQLDAGRKMVSEILFYQGIFADNYKQIFFVASL